ncbi:type IV pilus modification protein PilV [Acidovorax delafieldii 2AN]|uniref:Type IV pilus modification protein PilV n=1 Tax=Acidovorax delafieldii 2AN TaxID=573060 RepID=C5T0Y6_ACIDE|nr:type IV pilus modification protein PilV [Acidovorax delafieldii]EER61840.1 type IV pilus modification protein PilV [Acidovorax delafieldii 2AN]
MTTMTTTSKKHQRGITLIESLVAIVIAALGILGILGVQMRTLTDTQTTVRRAQAIHLIEDLSERMKVSPNALLGIGDYASGYSQKGSDLTVTDCGTATCTPAQQAKYDLKQWKTTVEQTLPGGQASVFLAPGETADANRRQLGVIIAWRENERDGTKTDDIDASKFRGADGVFTAGTDSTNACPADKTCHLQYIPVAARCAPYDNGSGTKILYCS